MKNLQFGSFLMKICIENYTPRSFKHNKLVVTFSLIRPVTVLEMCSLHAARATS